jgi:hypothetical protein
MSIPHLGAAGSWHHRNACIIDVWRRSFLGVARRAGCILDVFHISYLRVKGETRAARLTTGKPNGGTWIRTILNYEIQSFGGRGKLRGLPPPRFSAVHAWLVEKYIHANLGCELDLFDLASLVRLSPRPVLPTIFQHLSDDASPICDERAP